MLRPALWLAVAAAGPGAASGLHAERQFAEDLSEGAQLEFRAAPPLAGRGSVNHTAEAPALKRIHLISITTQGSCEALELFQRAGGGLPGLSEPLRFTVEGRTILTDPDSEFKRQQVRCLFSENFSEQDASEVEGKRAGLFF
ncbi:unnamed protein product [Prorocentrum cordatum]|uniref:Peptidylprolyl isomerase n=1 Tax=Prorocentrum cordatum TaxID=2364126 RepID=A0ABN9R4W8_9DINO|nr:unnamed protein product [Polarella glacialis]